MALSEPRVLSLIRNLFISIDQLGNTILLGHPDETISSRLGRSIGKERYFWVSWFRISVDFVFEYFPIKQYREKNHCKNSIIHLEQVSFRDFNYEIWSWNK